MSPAAMTPVVAGSGTAIARPASNAAAKLDPYLSASIDGERGVALSS